MRPVFGHLTTTFILEVLSKCVEPYYDILGSQFDLLPLYLKRLYKILNNMISCPDLLRDVSFHVPSRVTRSVTLIIV